jgi:Xaa-Pro dipeptidase
LTSPPNQAQIKPLGERCRTISTTFETPPKEAKNRTQILQSRMRDEGIRKAVFTDESSIAYLAGFWGYLGIEFGRPTMLVVDAEEAPIVITPLMESEMVAEMTWIKDVRVWEDMGQRSWGRALTGALGKSPAEIWVEKNTLPAILRNYLDETYPGIASVICCKFSA